MFSQRWIFGLFLCCILLQAFIVNVSSQDEAEVIAIIEKSADFYLKFVLQHFTAEFGVDRQSKKLEKVVRYWWSFGKGFIPNRYRRDPYDGSLFRVMNSWLTQKRPFLYQKPIADYDTRVVQIGQGASSRSVSYKSLVQLFFQDFLVLQHLTLDVEEMAKQKTKLGNLAASSHREKEKATFLTIRAAFVDKMRQLIQQMETLTMKFNGFLSNAEHLKLYLQEQYRISVQCGLIQATPIQFAATYLENQHSYNRDIYYFSMYKSEWNFRQLASERGDLFFQPIDNLKSRTVSDRSLPVWFMDFWLLAKEDTKQVVHAIPVCDMMKQYLKKGIYTTHLEIESYFSKVNFLVLMKDWVESQYKEMKRAQELIDEELKILMNPHSPQMRKRMEQCYLRSILSAWYAQIGNFREQLDQNRVSALTAARRYLVKMELWPKYAGKQDKAFEQWSSKQLGTGQQVMPQAMVKVPKPELWHYIPSKTMSLSQLDAIKNSFDLFAKTGSATKNKNFKKSNEWMYYRVRLAVYLAFLKPCSNAPSSLKQTFKKAPFGRLNLLGSKLSRKKKS